MKAFFKRVGLGLLAVFILLYALTASYYLPRTELVHVTGTEIKRLDRDQQDGSTVTTDVRYVMTKRIDDGSAMVFRNEDTGWGWPPYFKFDSGDLAGEAMNIAKTSGDATVLVRYYGWRTNLFSWYPNIVSVQVVEPDYDGVPIFNITFIVLSIIVFALLGWYVRKLSRRVFKKKQETGEVEAEAEPEPEPPAESEPVAKSET